MNTRINGPWIEIELDGESLTGIRPYVIDSDGNVVYTQDIEFRDGRYHCKLGTWWIQVLVSKSEDDLLVEIEKTDEGISWLGFEGRAGESDHYLGFGERYEQIDMKGQSVDLWVTNGAYGPYTYKPVPFFMNPVGYGVHIDTSCRVIGRMQCPDQPHRYSLHSDDNTLRIHFFSGPEIRNILKKYMKKVGLPVQLEPWVFGPWKSRDWQKETQETVYEDLVLQRELELPSTVKLIDASWQSEYNSFMFHPERFPDYERMLQDVQSGGYKMVLWVSPWMAEGTDAFQEAKENGFLLKTSGGETYVTRLANDPGFRGSCIDFTNPDAVQFWQIQIERLMKMGIAGFKTDFGEQVDIDAVFHNGKTGKEMHNLFPYLYNKATWEVVNEYQGILLGRSAWHGSQSFPGVWAGDQSADFCRWSGLPSAVIAGISAGLSGFSYWASDIGGYYSGPDKEVFIRWTQFGAFSPLMQVHGMGEHDPWRFDQETLEIYREYAKLRMRLLPYIEASGVQTNREGIPILRGLPLDWPDDQVLYQSMSAQYEYMFGEWILCAPMCYGGMSRDVYLPEGQWVDWWTGERLTGKQMVRAAVDLHRTPLYLRDGAMILYEGSARMSCLPVNDRCEKEQHRILEIVPATEGLFETADGETYRYNTVENKLHIDIDGCKPDRMVEIRLHGSFSVSSVEGAHLLTETIAPSLLAEEFGGVSQLSCIGLRPQQSSIQLTLEKELNHESC